MELELAILKNGEDINHFVFEQVIKQFDANGMELESVVNQYTMEELAYRVLPQEVINNKRDEGIQRNKSLKMIYKDTKTPTLPGEQWIQHRDKEFYVSNLGRIKNEKKIIPQIEKDPNTPGYLILEGYSLKEVYNYVAETWLEKPKGDTSMTVHHITNDGRDNRVMNLIWVKTELHFCGTHTIHKIKYKLNY